MWLSFHVPIFALVQEQFDLCMQYLFEPEGMYIILPWSIDMVGELWNQGNTPHSVSQLGVLLSGM